VGDRSQAVVLIAEDVRVEPRVELLRHLAPLTWLSDESEELFSHLPSILDKGEHSHPQKI
jgi:hypothetical protein